MARFFTQGTLTTETNYAKAVRIAMHTGFTAAIAAGKSTWSIEDHSYVNTTFERTVFSCSSGTGFSIMVGNSTSSTVHTFNSYIGKLYDSASHILSSIGFGTGSNTTADATGYSTTNYNPTAVQTTGTPTTHSSYNYITIPSTSSTWFLMVDDDYAVFSLKDGTAGVGTVWYFGAFNSEVTNTSLTDTAPYGLFQNGGGTSSWKGAFLQSLNNGGKNIYHNAEMGIATTIFTGRPAVATFYDIYKTGTKSVLSKINIFRNTAAALTGQTNPNTDGHHRGSLKGVAYASATSAAWGDQIDVNGTTYLYAGGVGSNHSSATAGTVNAVAWWVAIN